MASVAAAARMRSAEFTTPGASGRGPVRRFCVVTRRSGFPARSSPVCRFPGAPTRAMPISAATTWSGRATSSRRQADCSPPAPATDALRVLEYLRVTQNADGSWPQNMWVDGEPYWHGIQLDETALPILLVDLLQRDGVDADVIADFWPMVRRAASYIVRQGPVTEQDRWEEEPGFAPFTVAVEIAALLVAADLADRERRAVCCGRISARRLMPGTTASKNVSTSRAPSWRAGSASRATTSGLRRPKRRTPLLRRCGFVPIKNRPWPQTTRPRLRNRQPRCARAGQVRLAGAGRSEDREYAPRHRCAAQGGDARWPGVAAL